MDVKHFIYPHKTGILELAPSLTKTSEVFYYHKNMLSIEILLVNLPVFRSWFMGIKILQDDYDAPVTNQNYVGRSTEILTKE